MPNLQTNSISFQMTFIRDSLSNWAKQFGGKAVIAKDYSEMWEVASNVPGPKCIIVYDGEEVRGPLEWAAAVARVDRRYAVLVSRGQGFTAERADSLTQQINSTEAFMDLLEQARDIIRVLLFDPAVTEAYEGDPIDYKGIESVSVDGYPLDAYIIRFSIGTQLGTVKESFNFSLTGPANPPSDLNATDGMTNVVLNWTINSPNTTSTVIQRSDDGSVFATIGTAPLGSTTYTDLTVIPSTMYFYRVYSTSTTGDSGVSNITSIFV